MAIPFEPIIVELWCQSLKKLEKWIKLFHAKIAMLIIIEKLETPEYLKMRISIMKDTHDIINFIGI